MPDPVIETYNNTYKTTDDIIQELIETSKRLETDETFIPEKKLMQGYALFSHKFGPDKLKELNGEELIDIMFNIKNKDSLVYWLEFKNDDEFITSIKTYGSIAGGSSYKFGLFKRDKDDNWVTGSPTKPKILTTAEAIVLGSKIRDSLLYGADLINNLSENANINEYIHLQEKLEESLVNNMASLVWVHKYYHMIYPSKIDVLHAAYWKEHALICCNVKPKDGLYSMAGQLIQIVRKTGKNSSLIMYAMLGLFGGPSNYYRIGTSSSTTKENYWNEMLENNYIAIGRAKIGDLSIYDNEKNSVVKEKIVSKLDEYYPNNHQTQGKRANQIRTFYRGIEVGDIIVAADGEKTLGIGKVSGNYKYLEEKAFPHTLPVEWINVSSDINLPKPKEGLMNTLYKYKDMDNILEIRRLSNIKERPIKPIDPVIIGPSPLSGVAKEIKNVIDRKKQVILYGPPGTGKTYHAEKTCLELASRSLFNKSFNSLSEDEKEKIEGDGRTNGLVRMCTFHPSYGYEDFIEGIKPSVINDQTVFRLEDGIFKELCTEAIKNPESNYYLIIDEINRGDISRIFGELITLIEAGKRGKRTILPMYKEPFLVPENIYIVATMNTADRSIALLDAALRRRFGFIELMPDYSLLEGSVFEGLPLGKWLKELNASIVESIGTDGRNLQIGHSYFMEKEKAIISNAKFKVIIKEDIIPLLEEYCYGDYVLMSKILGEGIIDIKNQLTRKELFDSSDISDLVTALLAPYPLIREDIEIDEDDEDEEEDLASNDKGNSEDSVEGNEDIQVGDK